MGNGDWEIVRIENRFGQKIGVEDAIDRAADEGVSVVVERALVFRVTGGEQAVAHNRICLADGFAFVATGKMYRNLSRDRISLYDIYG